MAWELFPPYAVVHRDRRHKRYRVLHTVQALYYISRAKLELPVVVVLGKLAALCMSAIVF
jgi:hypothetical protein